MNTSRQPAGMLVAENSGEKVLATVVRLLDCTGIRIGNDEYARANRSFGLTPLRDRHVAISGSNIRFEFRGKSGKAHPAVFDAYTAGTMLETLRNGTSPAQKAELDTEEAAVARLLRRQLGIGTAS